MEYEQLIENWHAKASEEDYFSKFVFEYLAFIAHLRINVFSGCQESDRAIIEKLKKKDNIKDKYIHRIKKNKSLENNWEKVITKLSKHPLRRLSVDLQRTQDPPKWDCRTQEGVTIKAGTIHSLKDWNNMVEFWYRVRNNLFHGAKSNVEKRDQFLVKYGYLTLKELMEILINK